ncbi:hypothetical protein BpHYR1_030230 [Brachionus plicatilis]|uniref:Uncharacterized protein n=1 Tax=Brachionus plicatilis TaxID=10195 RepID=A0A3M7SKX1_BRAPC|nr:hypothetical protein BpHYR1_030230 [Brachionus plicatilis]
MYRIFRLESLEITGMDKETNNIYKTTVSSLPNSEQSDINVNADDDNKQTLSNEKSRPSATLRNDSDDSLLNSQKKRRKFFQFIKSKEDINTETNEKKFNFGLRIRKDFHDYSNQFQSFHRFLHPPILLNVCSQNQAIKIDHTEQE